MMFMSVLTLWGNTEISSETKKLPDSVRLDVEFLDLKKKNLENLVILDTLFINDNDSLKTAISKSLTSLNSLLNEYREEDFSENGINIDSIIKVYHQNFNKEYEYIENKHKEIIEDIIKASHISTIIIWILSAIGSLGFIITIFSLVEISRIKSRIDERKDEIGELEKKVLKQKEELLVLINRPQPEADKSIKKTKIPNISESPIEKTKPVVVTDKKEQKQSPQPVQEKSSVYYLFATAKAGSSYPEFYNVSRDKTLYKVYMLMLKNEEDEIAEFTIVPDMTPDFMKSVIDDRETHLPPIFCERSIDAQNPTRIEVVSTGIAKKEGGKWTVQERMKIKLV